MPERAGLVKGRYAQRVENLWKGCCRMKKTGVVLCIVSLLVALAWFGSSPLLAKGQDPSLPRMHGPTEVYVGTDASYVVDIPGLSDFQVLVELHSYSDGLPG